MAPLIGITTYQVNRADKFDLPADYVRAVRRAGGDVVLLPPGAGDPAAIAGRLDGVVLAGGGDIDPATYGGAGHEMIYSLDPDRDRDELALARWVLAAGLPTLAICRGHQIVQVAAGGTLHPHLPDVVGFGLAHRVEPPDADSYAGPTPHPVAVSPSRLATVLGTSSPEPMSWHHQSVHELAPGFRVVAEASDGTIEAVESDDHPSLLSIQWHPELTAATDPSQQRLFDWLTESATARRGTGS